MFTRSKQTRYLPCHVTIDIILVENLKKIGFYSILAFKMIQVLMFVANENIYAGIYLSNNTTASLKQITEMANQRTVEKTINFTVVFSCVSLK